MQAEMRTAQLRVRPNAIIAEGGGGTIFYATPTRAKLLIDHGAAELVNVGPTVRPAAGPTETKPTGPTEFKEPAEKKSYSQGGPAGPLTDSQPSIESGKAKPSSSLVAAHRSPKTSANPSPKRGRPAKSKR